MKKIFTLSSLFLGLALCFSACKSKPTEMIEKSELQLKVEEFAFVDLNAPELIAQLSEKEKQMIPIFIQIAEIMDQLFWKQTFGDKTILDTITDIYMADFAMINYGPWERLKENQPFVPGYGAKPDGCQYYPQDITLDEFNAFKDPNKGSLYTVLRRNEDGSLKTVWYKDEYKEELDIVCQLLDQAIELAEDNGLRNYLIERKKAFQTDDYFTSDMAWMDMKESKLDFVVGPIENYDDKLQEAKASYEAFVLVKDEARSNDLAKFVSMLPALQKQLPCEPKYKTFVPGTSSDLNVYNAIYYGGDCNSGSKTIAINLPNDDRVAATKGTRRLQLRNSMKAKFDKILMPIGELMITPEQQANLNFDAFFWNVTFHEVAHGIGIKNTINGKGSVDKALATEKTSWEEAKADILGLFLVMKLIDMGEITNITKEDAMVTYIAGILRSVRFGAASSHGKANMMCFNFFEKAGAFVRDANQQYVIDFDKAFQAMNNWAELIIVTQGNGDLDFAVQYRSENGGISETLQADLDKINNAGIPRDIRFNQGLKVLGLE
ncbi:MAG: Zn-dependent hydrolase [Lentimicrobiaceae bacterium]|nr:Zn-dependent hydrolase [Lentimicrobiaceae bacterium]